MKLIEKLAKAHIFHRKSSQEKPKTLPAHLIQDPVFYRDSIEFLAYEAGFRAARDRIWKSLQGKELNQFKDIRDLGESEASDAPGT